MGTEAKEEAGSEAAPTIAIEESLLPGPLVLESRILPGTGWWEGPGEAVTSSGQLCPASDRLRMDLGPIKPLISSLCPPTSLE